MLTPGVDLRDSIVNDTQIGCFTAAGIDFENWCSLCPSLLNDGNSDVGRLIK